MPKKEFDPNTVAGFLEHRIKAMLELLPPSPHPTTHVGAIKKIGTPRFQLDPTPLILILNKLADHQHIEVEPLRKAVGLNKENPGFGFEKPAILQVMVVAAALKCNYAEFSSLLGMVEHETLRRLEPDFQTGNLRDTYEHIEKQAQDIFSGKETSFRHPPAKEAHGPTSQRALHRK